MSLTVKFHLFHCRQGTVRDARTRESSVILLHSRVERTRVREWMCVLLYRAAAAAYGNPPASEYKVFTDGQIRSPPDCVMTCLWHIRLS